MKIAMTHVDLPSEGRGGVAYQVHYLANALVDRGHDVTVFTFSPAHPEGCYRVHRFSAPARGRRGRSFLLALHLARTDFRAFDILHTHGDNYLLRGRHPQVRTFYGSARDEAQSAVTWRRRMSQTLLAHLEQAGARAADVNVGISEATRARVPAVSAIVPCGVDLSCFKPGSKAKRPVIFFVGTTGGRKRGQLLADVFLREVRPRFPEAELWVVAEAPMLGEGIVNFGKVPLGTLVELYQRAWIFCLPSTYEGFGIPYVEALASGTPVVASANPGAQEVLCGGSFGILAPDAKLGSSINELLDDERARQQYAAKGLVRAQTFGWERVVAQYEGIYTELVARFPRLCSRRDSA